jgi:hypothetical protein
MAKALSSGAEAMLAHSENRHRRAAASNNENHDLVEVAKGIVDQFRETLPLLDLNLTGHAENPRGWTATRIEQRLRRPGQARRAHTEHLVRHVADLVRHVAAAYPGALARP